VRPRLAPAQSAGARHDPVRDLRVLTAVARALNGTPDMHQALTHTLALVAELLRLEAGWVWLLDPETGHFYNAAAQRLPAYLREPMHMTGTTCWCIENFQKGELTPTTIAMRGCSRLRAAVRAGVSDATQGLRYHASIPLYAGARPVGIMNVAAPARRPLTAVEVRLLAAVGYQAGDAVDRARLTEERTRLARAEERTRLAREIHDTLAQDLAAIALHLESALPHLEGDPERARARLQQALKTTRQGLEDARGSVLALRAGIPGDRPLAEALGVLGRAFTAETGVRVQVRTTPGTGFLPLPIEAELYRIAQAALANIRAHAAARVVTITLRTGVRTATLSISDDGCGFDPHAIGAGHHGLVGMRERAAFIGGRLRVASQTGRGTRVTVVTPHGHTP